MYKVSGTTEQAAMTTAEGKVAAYKYVASFPLLINVSNQPTYFLALKDDNQVNQKFAMVNVQQFNKIFVVGDSLADCLTQYLTAMETAGIDIDINVNDIKDSDNNGQPEQKTETVTGVVAEIRTAVIGGESWYYIKLTGSDIYYSIAASKAADAIILNTNDNVTVTFTVAAGTSKIIPADTLAVVK